MTAIGLQERTRAKGMAMRQFPAPALGACILLSAIQPAAASHVIDQASFTPGEASRPELAVSADHYTALAYRVLLDGDPQPRVAVQLLPTDPFTDEVWPDPMIFGPADLHAICWSREGFTLAYTHEDTVWVCRCDPFGGWDLAGRVRLLPGGEVRGLDLCGLPFGYHVPGKSPSTEDWPTEYLCIDVDVDPTYGEDYRVHFTAHRPDFGWLPLTTLVEDLAFPPRSQIDWVPGELGPMPAVYFLGFGDEEYGLFRIHLHEGGGWTAPWPIPGDGLGGPTPFGGAFDVARHDDIGIIGLGPQPTCPCGTLHLVAWHKEGGWQPSRHLTVHYDFYDWPFCPRIDIGGDDTMHLFWYQVDSDMTMTPLRQRLEYRLYRDGEMVDAGGFLKTPDLRRGLGEHVDVGVCLGDGRSVMAWSKTDTIAGVPQPERIFVARQDPLSSAPPSAVPRPALAVQAWPNPFNPRVNLRVTTTDRDGPLQLSIVDARGRLVRRLHVGPVATGDHDFAWGGRRDDGGRAPSGVYFAVAADGSDRAVRKVVLAE
jgi:hypothetical protein